MLIVAVLKDDYDFSQTELIFSLPAERKFGDLSTTLAFALAKKTKSKPFLVAGDMAAKLRESWMPEIEIRVAGGGFLNFYLRRDDFLLYLWQNLEKALPVKSEKVIVEHTSINPNKSAHIGHLRNSCLGDILARSCRFLGYEVEVQNYIDDTGIQIADVVWGLLHYQKKDLDGHKKNIRPGRLSLGPVRRGQPAVRRQRRSGRRQRRDVHKKIEEKIDPEYEACRYIAEQVLLDHIRTMEQVGIHYDLLARESDVIALDFFKAAAAEMTARERDDPLRRSRKKKAAWSFITTGKKSKRSSSAPTAPSPTWARTSPTTCGNSTCCPGIFTTAFFTPIPTAIPST